MIVDDQLIDDVIDMLGDQWNHLSGFANSIDKALMLPIDDGMWWELQTAIYPTHKPSAELKRGIKWNEKYN